jgi:hypothetical protein
MPVSGRTIGLASQHFLSNSNFERFCARGRAHPGFTNCRVRPTSSAGFNRGCMLMQMKSKVKRRSTTTWSENCLRPRRPPRIHSLANGRQALVPKKNRLLEDLAGGGNLTINYEKAILPGTAVVLSAGIGRTLVKIYALRFTTYDVI